MDSNDLLMTSLLDLVFELRELNIPLIIGGGFGLFLKQLRLRETGERTLLDQLPQARSTNDLDICLRAEVLADSGRMRVMGEILQKLGFAPIESARYWQFVKEFEQHEGSVKIDLLGGPPGPFSAKVKIESRRIKPVPSVNLHARYVQEAVGLEDEPVAIPVSGVLSTGEKCSATVYVPQAFPYMMMKLFAFRDRKADPNKDLGRHHALDLYRIVAMMTENEYERALGIRQQHASVAVVRQAGEIVREDFSHDQALGILRLREHPQFGGVKDVQPFLEMLSEVFLPQNSS